MINSRKIEDLHPKVQELCRKFIDQCKIQHGIGVIITSTYRDFAYQRKLYEQGRVTPGKKVTNAKPGESFHNFRVAFDFVPLKGKEADWGDVEKFKKCGLAAEKIGLEWGGKWKKFIDLPHCQYTGGLTIKDFNDGKTLPIG